MAIRDMKTWSLKSGGLYSQVINNRSPIDTQTRQKQTNYLREKKTNPRKKNFYAPFSLQMLGCNCYIFLKIVIYNDE